MPSMYIEKVGGVHILSIALLLKSDVISGWPSLLLYCVRHGQRDILIYNMSEVIGYEKPIKSVRRQRTYLVN